MEPDQEIFETWPLLTAVALAFLGVFLVVVGLSSVPVRLLDPLWQLGLAASITTSGGYLLNGLALLFLASVLAPDSPALLRGLLQARRWAAIASLCFLLLVPLQLVNLWRIDSSSAQAAARNRQALESRMTALRSAVAQTSSTAELREVLQTFGAPPLNSMDLELPAPELRQRVLDTFDVVEGSARRSFEGARNQARDPALLRRTIQSIVLALLFGLALAAGARLPGSRLSLLQQFRALLSLPWRLAQLGGIAGLALIEAYQDGRAARAASRLPHEPPAEAHDAHSPAPAEPSGPFARLRKGNGFVEEEYIRLIQEEEESP